ncbi:hypothetical protein CC78DRAFT_303802 [Lojkania enalia]|uniref:Secreted protein n=1 Tax=Lojkania enalia TaxID=147567 RepID=A0A9P4N9K4_9PLEO|nr:hypothetical protein CC78DRAFT_303802 [Didymosphaeria enalia]
MLFFMLSLSLTILSIATTLSVELPLILGNSCALGIADLTSPPNVSSARARFHDVAAQKLSLIAKSELNSKQYIGFSTCHLIHTLLRTSLRAQHLSAGHNNAGSLFSPQISGRTSPRLKPFSA